MKAILRTCAGLSLLGSLIFSATATADAIRAVQMDPEMLAGINLPPEEQFIPPEDILAGTRQPRAEILHYGDQLIMEVYEDE